MQENSKTKLCVINIKLTVTEEENEVINFNGMTLLFQIEIE